MTTIETTTRADRRLAGLRATTLAAVIMLLTEYALGLLTHLYGKAPATDHGRPVFAAFWAAVVNGPVLLTAHALLGTLLVATAITALVRASRLRNGSLLGLTITALVCILGAWFAGSSLVAGYQAGKLLTMGLADAVAIGCYVVGLSLSRG